MSCHLTRRSFLKQTITVTVASAGGPGLFAPRSASGFRPISIAEKGSPAPISQTWHRRTLRWGQTNITEVDPPRYDVQWWRQYWKRTRTQGVIINAGGIVAYYPSQVPFHRPARLLGDRDLFGELCRAAHEDGLVVLARMDSNRAHEELHAAHPDWFAVDSAGNPYKAGELFVTCVNGPYYREHVPSILREIVERYHPDFSRRSTLGTGRYGASASVTAMGPAPGPPPPCGWLKVLCRLKCMTSTPKSPGRVRPRIAFMLAPSM